MSWPFRGRFVVLDNLFPSHAVALVPSSISIFGNAVVTAGLVQVHSTPIQETTMSDHFTPSFTDLVGRPESPDEEMPVQSQHRAPVATPP